MNLKNPVFIQSVIDKKQIPEKEFGLLRNKSKLNDYDILLYLISQSILDPNDAGKLWADSLSLTYINLQQTLFKPEIVSLLPKEFAIENSIVCIYHLGDMVTAAMADPGDRKTIAKAEQFAKQKISPLFSFESDIKDSIDIHYHTLDDIEKASGKIDLSRYGSKSGEISAADLNKIAGNEAIIEFVRGVLLLSVRENASDIHIEPLEKILRIRFRIDGRMVERLKLDPALTKPLVSRLKIMANLDIAEKRRPLDGRINLKLSNSSIDFRMSTAPSLYGEKVVLRLLGEQKNRLVPILENLSFSKSIYEKVKKLVATPNGVFFVTGPTGSGKTTTLFSALRYINNPEINIITVEDPIEYRLPGITQIQVNRNIDLNFQTVLRSALRQDPDVILVGEIRDLETAKTATEAALTGHLVLSTLHTNDAIQAVTRLVEIGVEPFIVGPSIIGVLAQRLVRRICESCKESYLASREIMDELFDWDGKEALTLYKGGGCHACSGTGYKGRIGIHEMLMVDNQIREMLSKNSSHTILRASAYEKGYRSMWYDGIKKAVRGLTTVDEILRVTFQEE
jgi:type IV pilus assembly protein PilB